MVEIFIFVEFVAVSPVPRYVPERSGISLAVNSLKVGAAGVGVVGPART